MNPMMNPVMMGGMGMGGMHPGMNSGIPDIQFNGDHDEHHSSSEDGHGHRRRLMGSVENPDNIDKLDHLDQLVVPTVPESEYKIIEKCMAGSDKDICVTYYYVDQSIAIDIYESGLKVPTGNL